MGIFSKSSKKDKKVTSKNAMDAVKKSDPGVSAKKANVARALFKMDEANHVWLTIKSNSLRTFNKPFEDESLLNATGPSRSFFENDFETSLGFFKTGTLKGEVKEPVDYVEDIVKDFPLNEAEFKALFLYINSKRSHSYTLGFDNLAFAQHALKAAGKTAPDGRSSSSARQSLDKEFDDQKTQRDEFNTAYDLLRDMREGKVETSVDGIEQQINTVTALRAALPKDRVNKVTAQGASLEDTADFKATQGIRERKRTEGEVSDVFSAYDKEPSAATSNNLLKYLVKYRNDLITWEKAEKYLNKMIKAGHIKVINREAFRDLFNTKEWGLSTTSDFNITKLGHAPGYIADCISLKTAMDTLQFLETLKAAVGDAIFNELVVPADVKKFAVKLSSGILDAQIRMKIKDRMAIVSSMKGTMLDDVYKNTIADLDFYKKGRIAGTSGQCDVKDAMAAAIEALEAQKTKESEQTAAKLIK